MRLTVFYLPIMPCFFEAIQDDLKLTIYISVFVLCDHVVVVVPEICGSVYNNPRFFQLFTYEISIRIKDLSLQEHQYDMSKHCM